MQDQRSELEASVLITSNCWKTICAIFVICAAMASAAFAQTFKTLASFDGVNGSTPSYGSLVQGRNGNYYGSTGIWWHRELLLR